MAASDQAIVFTRGVPPAEALPGDAIADCAAAILRADGKVLLQYGSSLGYLPLRQWLAETHDQRVEQVLVSNGSLQIMGFLCRALLSPGDVVFVESPSYDRAITIFRQYQARVVGIPLEPDGVSLAALEEALTRYSPKLFYAIGDFQNPSGVTTSAAKRRRITELAESRGFWIAEDVPYRPLRYAGVEEPTFLSLAPERVLQLSSFSKQISPGLRAGFLIGPAEVVSRIARAAEDTYITPVLPAQGIVYEFCRRGLLEPNLARLRDLYRPRLAATLDALGANLSGAEWTRPEGGFFVGVTLPPGIETSRLLARAREVGLTLTNGDGFFPEPPARAFVRIPFCGVSPAQIRDGVARLASACRSL